MTIAGQSAGGGSVMSQTACPDNTGLFRGAVVMSAMIFDPYLRREIGRPEKLADAEKKGEEFFAFLGVKNLKEARALDAVTLQRSYEKYMEGHTPFFTVQDDLFCVGDPIALYTRGECVDAVMMVNMGTYTGNSGVEKIAIALARRRSEEDEEENEDSNG